MASINSLSDVTGYFSADSVTWQLYREPICILGGVRALILQVAHPAVADGVARYSGFQADPFGRGYRTFTAMAMIYFGTKKQADETARLLWRIHSAIQGQYELQTSNSKLQTPNSELQTYSANDPDLLLWVLATIIDTTYRVYEKVPLPGLPPDWRERFYEESKIAAQVLGIPENTYPPDFQAFEMYFNKMLNSDLLGSTATCREMTQAIIRHPRAPKKWAALFSAGWLPEPLCRRLGIEAGEDPEVRLDNWLRRFGKVYRFVPGGLRYNPAYHQAKYRIAKAEGKSPTPAGIFFNWLGKRVKIPLGLGVGRNGIPT